MVSYLRSRSAAAGPRTLRDGYMPDLQHPRASRGRETVKLVLAPEVEIDVGVFDLIVKALSDISRLIALVFTHPGYGRT